MITIVVLYVFFVLMFEGSFIETRYLFFYIFKHIFYLIFIFDIFYNFNRAYVDKNDKLVVNRKKIAINYLKSWFIVDFLAAFPFILFRNPDGSLRIKFKSDALFSLFPLFRLLKILKIIAYVFHLTKNSNSLRNYSAQLKHKKRQFVLTITMVILYCHFFTCMFYTLPFYLSETNWVRTRGLENRTLFEKYLFSLHFTIETVITVGYGENPLE